MTVIAQGSDNIFEGAERPTLAPVIAVEAIIVSRVAALGFVSSWLHVRPASHDDTMTYGVSFACLIPDRAYCHPDNRLTI